MAGVEYQVTKVDPTDPHTKGAVYQVHEVSEEVAATLGGKVYRARIIKDPTAPTVVGKVYQIVLIEDPSDPTVKGKVYNAILTGDSAAVVVGPAVSPLVLQGAIANSLQYVKAFGGTEQRNLPAEYTQVNYVTNTVITAVNTGVMIDFAKNYEFEVECSAVSGSWYILQSRETAGASITGISGSQNGNTISLVVGGIAACTSTVARTVGNKLYVKATLNNGVATLYVKDKTAGTEDTQTGSYDTPQTNPTTAMYLLGNAAGQYASVNSDVYMARIKENGVAVMDYVPAKQGATTGFYDKASGTFKTALTPESLSAGPDVVPTPDAPMDIVSNNGVLKVSPNLFDKNASYALFDGYINNVSVGENTTLMAYSGGDKTIIIKVVPNTTYTVTRATDLGSVYERIRCAAFTTLPSSSSTGVVLYNLSSNTQQANATFTTLSDTQYVAINVRNSGAVGDDWTQFVDAFQLEKGSTATPYMPYGQIYTDGTVETIKDSLNNTATAEMLLKVGDYQDEQEILSGAVTRNVGVLVLDGTEDWVKGQSFYCNALAGVLQADHSCYCTHYQGIMNNSAVVPDSNTCRVGYHIGSDIAWDRLYIYADRSLYATAADFANYLAQQYAAGTPVIVIYPLATPTTESVAGQTMQVQAGNNVLEITQASLTGLELEAEYQKG